MNEFKRAEFSKRFPEIQELIQAADNITIKRIDANLLNAVGDEDFTSSSLGRYSKGTEYTIVTDKRMDVPKSFTSEVCGHGRSSGTGVSPLEFIAVNEINPKSIRYIVEYSYEVCTYERMDRVDNHNLVIYLPKTDIGKLVIDARKSAAAKVAAEIEVA